MVETIESAAQSSAPGDRVDLYRLDATSLGGPLLGFVHGTVGDAVVHYDTAPYQPMHIKASGFEWSGDGDRPTPSLTLTGDPETITPLLLAHGRLQGCGVTRTRTLTRFLDGQPDADPDAYWAQDVFAIDRTLRNGPEFTFELRSATDVRGQMIPGQQAVKRFCRRRYRVWDASANGGMGGYDYSGVACPYAGGLAFNAQGQAVAAPLDACGKLLGDCKLRFGAHGVLPTKALPGLARVR